MKKLITLCVLSICVFNNSLFCTKDLPDPEIKIPEYVIDASHLYPDEKKDLPEDTDSTDNIDNSNIDNSSDLVRDDSFENSKRDKKGLLGLLAKIRKKFSKIKNVKSFLEKHAVTGLVISGVALSGYALVKVIKNIKGTIKTIASTASKAAFCVVLAALLFKE